MSHKGPSCVHCFFLRNSIKTIAPGVLTPAALLQPLLLDHTHTHTVSLVLFRTSIPRVQMSDYSRPVNVSTRKPGAHRTKITGPMYTRDICYVIFAECPCADAGGLHEKKFSHLQSTNMKEVSSKQPIQQAAVQSKLLMVGYLPKNLEGPFPVLVITHDICRGS